MVGGGLQVWRRGPGNAWTSLSAGLPTSGWQALQLLDLDADGRCDLLAFGAGKVGAWRGDGAGGWAPAAQLATPGGGPKTFRAFRAGADLDHNGYPDFAFVHDEGGGFSSANRLRVFREASVPAQRRVRVTAPGPGRTWRAGQVAWVEWLSAVPPGQPAGSVSVDWSPSGPGGPWEQLAGGLPDNGRAQVTLPAGAITPHAWVRVTLTAAGGTWRDLGGPLHVVD